MKIKISKLFSQVMMLGELEYDELYYNKNQNLSLTLTGSIVNGSFANGSFASGEINEFPQSQFFPFTAHILVTLFILLVSIIIMNLLFGLAVTDIQVRFYPK